MHRLADLIGENAERLARVEVRDTGKLYREMIGQLQGLGAWYCYFSGLADKIEGRVIPSDKPNYFVYTRREPVGVVGAITPWNSPLLLMTLKLAPALAAGCTFVVKPSEHSPASTLAFAQVLHEAGFPAGVFNVVTGSGRELGAALAGHPGVDKVAFTGSTATGRAGRAGRRGEPQPGDAGAGRQVAAGRLRGRRPRRGRQRHRRRACSRRPARPAWPARG